MSATLANVTRTFEKRRTSGRVLLGGGLLGVAVVLAGLNLRPAVTSVGSVLDEVRESLGASSIWAGALTTAPGLCFAAAGSVAPWVSRRVGLPVAVSLALALLTAGLLVRVLDGKLVVLGGTVVATAGIALANVLIPVVVKDSFPARIGLMSGLYSAALQTGGALGSAVTPPAATALGGWRQGLGGWSVLGGAALVLWLVAARTRPASPATRGASDTSAAPGEDRGPSLFGNRLAWTVTLFFGLQACGAYIIMGWLPEMLVDAGISRDNAGLLLGLVSILGMPVSLFLVPLAVRARSQSWWIVGLSVLGLVGVVGLMMAPAAQPVLWSVCLGMGMSVFSLAITLVALRARTGADTARLSAMAQGIGYLLAAVGPFLFGFLYDVTGGWTVPCVLLLASTGAQMIFGWLAGRPRFV
jgi:MFS transporter, CP family, cyanate transporter